MGLLVAIAAVLYLWHLTGRQRQQSGGAPPPTPDTSFDQYTSTPGPLDYMAQAIYQFEGGKPGDRNLRNKNPGDLKSAPGATGTAGGYATFSTFGDGWNALKNYLAGVAAKHPDWNFYDLFSYYLGGNPEKGPAPSDQGNSLAYAEYVAKYVRVPPTTPVASYLGMS